MPQYSAADGVKQKFTGKERDNETELDYSINRYYSSAQGRFTSPDPLLESGEPLQPQSWNRYSYTINNPLKFVDPDGLRYVQRTLKNGDVKYGWCATDECYDNALNSGWSAVTFDESEPFEYTCRCGSGGDLYGGYRLNPDGTHGNINTLDGNYHAMSTDWNAQLAIGGLFRSLFKGIAGLFARQAATEATTQAATQATVQAEGAAARTASSAFGRSIQSLRTQLSSGGGPWRKIATLSEPARGRWQGARSIEEVFVNRETGERIVRHIIQKGNQVHETFRTYLKVGR